MINKLKYWNAHRESEEDELKNDIPYALAIYLSIESPNNTVNEDAIEFIVDLLRVRTDNEYRIQGAIQAVREYCNSQNRKPY